MSRTPGLAAVAQRLTGPAMGALAGQVTLAAGSLLLQVAAARALGAEGLGTYALLFSAIVVFTAVSTGLVGDSLTVLDRHEPRIRSALVLLAGVMTGAAAVLALLLGLWWDQLSAGAVAWFAAATVAFILADLTRRLLMAVHRFWQLVAVDLAGLAAAVGVVAVSWLLTEPKLAHLLAALAAGQAVAALVAWRLLPPAERTRARPRTGAVRAVLGFGGWRAMQQFVRPTSLSTARWLVLVAAGTAAVGELEAARVFVAPAMILIQGLGSFLFATYASDQHRPVAEMRARADRAAAGLLIGAVTIGAAAWALTPLLGGLISGGRFEIAPLAVLGWTAYAASCAAVLPYGSLAAVRGEAAQVLILRVVDSALSLGAVALAVLVLGADPAITPWLLGLGSFLGGLVCRQFLLADRPVGRHTGPTRSPARSAARSLP
ncbi:hypothetical protein [Nocardioides insulae]|uniref:hypothetical protein n=1 Tax=Nocardioides insulae TaxID=394734 RepID=UPI00041F6097|nr:hypothetical protein [Nocardioides insulae]